MFKSLTESILYFARASDRGQVFIKLALIIYVKD